MGRPGANQVFKLHRVQEVLDVRPATFFTDASVKDRDRSSMNLAANAFKALASVNNWLREQADEV